MKVKVTGIILCIMMCCISVLSGCGLISMDRKAYLNTVVATFTDKETGKKHEVIKKDLISAYNSYGYYYTQSGYSPEKALDATLELLVNRQIMLVEAEKMFDKELSDKEKTYLWKKTLEGLESNFRSYYNKVSGITSSEDDQTSSSSDRVFNGYTKNAELNKNGDGFEIVRTDTGKREIDNFEYDGKLLDASKEEDRKLMYTNFLSTINSNHAGENYKKAYNNYLKALKDNEEGMKLSTASDEVFLREIERIYKIQYEAYMITKYEETFRNYEEISSISAEEILEYYSSFVRASYAKYGIENTSTYETDMQSDSTAIYYYKDGKDDTKFFQVAHVLVKFTEDQAKEYKDILAQYGSTGNGAISEEGEYNQKLLDLAGKMQPVVRERNSESGVYEEKSEKLDYEMSASALAEKIKELVDVESTTQGKFDTFRELIYKYNDDPGMINASNNYTIGVNYSEAEEGKNYKSYSNYVEQFTDTAIKLYNNGKGKVGDVSAPVMTENGLHVLFYVGEIQNIFGNINENFALNNNFTDDKGLTPIEVLYNTRINNFVDKTYFDVAYDALYKDNFTNFQNNNIDALREQYTIKHNKSNYKDLTK